MKLILQPPKKAIKALLRQNISRAEIDLFKANMIALLDRISIIEKQPKDESEEHLKNNLRDFLRDTYYKETNAINTKERIDLVIHLGKTTGSEAGVIIEAKRPGNYGEMISADNPNKKALHELILYYLDERIQAGNNQLKQLAITNVYEWFIFDANTFDKFIFRNSQIQKLYETKTNDKKDNPFFYEEVARIMTDIDDEIPCIYFDIRSYEAILRNDKKEDDRGLITLFKIFSPHHLLKLAAAHDSNALNEKFYKELLHLIGLEEVRAGGKNIIRRKIENRSPASLIELTVDALNTEDSLHRVHDLSIYGETQEDRTFNVALELCITWINRILFLKLLEGQLISYHASGEEGRKGDDYRFLNPETIPDFDELFKLFHKVLAVNIGDRTEAIKLKYNHVPYLNSSLFELSTLEDQTIRINALDNSVQLELLKNSVISKSVHHREKMKTLEYLFRFFDAFDFASEGKEDIREDSKTLINASVLGKVFEKINGYKEGSIFTPGFITMYMCRQTIRLAVIQKFKIAYGWNIEHFQDIRNHIANRKTTNDILEFNALINSLRICDPAVGSGHFLVSALNEIIAIKHELGLLADVSGILFRDYEFTIEHDELIATDYKGELFEYHLQKGNYINKEVQRLQQTLFHEKQIIIENCLFGVDINPNSVKICRLRLWIELLKNAYYREETLHTSSQPELETLPNIDINIKCGNSLISRYPLDSNIKKALSNSKWTIDTYKLAISTYHNAKSKEVKHEMQDLILKIKQSFSSEIRHNDPIKTRIDKLGHELYNRFTGSFLFEPEVNYGGKESELERKRKKEREKIEKEINELSQKMDDIKNNKIYRNAFEWRFEFPEALNDDGDFVGFDVIVGNPPYIPLEALDKSIRETFRSKYLQVERKYDTSVLFILEGFKLLKDNGLLTFIAPITWQTGENYAKLRSFFLSNFGIDNIVNLPFNTFENAYVETSIYNFTKAKKKEYKIYNFDKKEENDMLEKIDFTTIQYLKLKKPNYKIILNTSSNDILERFTNGFYISLGSITKSTQGLSGSRFLENYEQGDEIFPFLKKGNVYNYQLVIEETFNTNLSDKRNLMQFYEAEEKVLIRRIVNRQDRLSVGFTDRKMVFKKDINPFIPTDKMFSAKYLLAILASKYISYLYVNSSAIATKDDFRQTTLAELRAIPIRRITYSDQRPFITLVDKILLAKQHGEDTTGFEKEIDVLVYQLYEINPEEVNIIEGD